MNAIIYFYANIIILKLLFFSFVYGPIYFQDRSAISWSRK